MMTKRHYILVGEALSDLPLSARMMVYHRLCSRLGGLDKNFDPNRFGETMKIPPLMRRSEKIKFHQNRK